MKLAVNKLNNKKITGILKELKKDFLKNYDLIWLLEQSLGPGNWEVYGGEKGFLIKRNNICWVNPLTGGELDEFYKFITKDLPVHIHCYQNWICQYLEEKHYRLSKGENIYLYCQRENFKGRKKRISSIITYEDVQKCKEKWYSPEILDFLKQNQKVYGIINGENLLLGWCYIDSLTKGVAEIYRIEIHPMNRRRGYAIDILSSAIEDIFNYENYVVINIDSNNIEGINLFQKLGFKEIQREYRYLLK